MLKSIALATTAALACASVAIAQGNPASQPSAATTASQPSASMIPPASDQTTTSTTTTTSAAPSAGSFTPIVANPSADIVATLKASGEFTTLLKATDATQLTAILQRPGAITVFAPTDAAFAALPAGTLAMLMQPANSAKLQHILAYHVVNAKVSPDQLKGHAAGPVPSIAGPALTLDGSGDTITVNGTPVVQSAVPTSNGVIYVIGTVLTPPS